MASQQTAPTFADINTVKADFNEIYRRHDPRAYYSVLGGLDYVIPEVAQPIFSQLIDRCAEERGRPIKVLDVGCSYGVNAALLRRGVTMRQLRERYLTPSIQALTPERLSECDARYFSSWPARSNAHFCGIDTSAEAIAYARRAGLISDGAACNLEAGDLPTRVATLLSSVDLVISTGCVGYITHATFEKIMRSARGRRPWIASFVLRMFDYDAIAQTLARHSLITEKLQGATFVQRRFRDTEEQRQTIEALDELGIDATGKEADGLLHAELFVSRPEESAAACQLTDIISLTSGIARPQGDRQRIGSTSTDEMAA